MFLLQGTLTFLKFITIKNKMLCINPGAAGNYGIHFVKTIVCFDVDKEKIKNLNIVELSRNKSSNSIS